jgi:hypothetical protein
MSDMMVSTADFSADSMAMKFRNIHRNWQVMFAGNDVTRVQPLLRKAKARLKGDAKLSLEEVEDAMHSHFKKNWSGSRRTSFLPGTVSQ